MRSGKERLESLRVEIYADGADLDSITALNENPFIKGFTTNPSLARKAGVTDYRHFADEVLSIIEDKPVSFEVLADDEYGMIDQANEIASWGDNVYVKIPAKNTEGTDCFNAIASLANNGVKVNVTAVMTKRQVHKAVEALDESVPAIISIFAGRIADVGVNAFHFMQSSKIITMEKASIKLLWASPRQLYDIFQADAAKADIITVSHGILDKLPLIGTELEIYSQETVKQFYNDAVSSGLSLD